jgi:hypothetical protein
VQQVKVPVYCVLAKFMCGMCAEYCYDEPTCKARAKQFPVLTTSTTQNASTVIDGLLQPFPESNPNFYKSHGVFVPYCSSDFWLGNSTAKFTGVNGKKSNFEFRGAAIMQAVMEDLLNIAPSGHDDDGETEKNYRFPVRNAGELSLSIVCQKLMCKCVGRLPGL